MWLSPNGMLNFPAKTGGVFLLEDEWKSPETVNFEVEEENNFEVIVLTHSESLRKKK